MKISTSNVLNFILCLLSKENLKKHTQNILIEIWVSLTAWLINNYKHNQLLEAKSSVISQYHKLKKHVHVQKKLVEFNNIKKKQNFKQKSDEWLRMRQNYLTASSIATVLGFSGKGAKQSLLYEKSARKSSKFTGSFATGWGEKYEPVARDLFSFKNQIQVDEYDLLPSTKYPFLAVSPDGITEKGDLLEIKCPYSRVIDGKIKTDYYHQMQEQMVVCELDKAIFLECKFEEMTDHDFLLEHKHYKGIVISYLKKVPDDDDVDDDTTNNDPKCYKYEDPVFNIEYAFSPIVNSIDDLSNVENLKKINDQLITWFDQTVESLNQNPDTFYLSRYNWKNTVYRQQDVPLDKEWIKTYIPRLTEFWNKICYYRKNGCHELEQLMEGRKQQKRGKVASECIL